MRSRILTVARFRLTVIALWLLHGCASLPPDSPRSPETHLAYVAAAQEPASTAQAVPAEAQRQAPIIIPDWPDKPYNRVGTVAARTDAQGEESLYIDPRLPVYYVQRREVDTDRGHYTNLIYRVHFERVPLRLLPLNLTAGGNVGLFIIITLDAQHHPVLITTVHTCGCYLAFLPTSYLPDDALPKDWPVTTQEVFGEQLPARLNYPEDDHGQYRPTLYLRGDSHRVRDVRLATPDAVQSDYRLVPARLQAMSRLRAIPLNDTTTSFFHSEGYNKGYVKDSFKPFELLFMSWWTLDLHVGVDKALGDPQETGTVFYTSLKPWRHEISNLWNFPRFLAYWGWRL